ncbi:MAG: hypothetical protein P8N02_07905 [Actinomycetota bacterium]|nr:hypothetical protein [Actinomycetota bacterium]
MTELPCTALEADWGDDRPNALMHPQCACPKCAVDPLEMPPEGEGWLRISGHRQRYRVEAVELGETGSQLLG